MGMNQRRAIVLSGVLSLLLHGCGGGGGGGSTAAQPSVSLTASATSIVSGSAVTLNWTSANASACTASGGWSGSKGTSGSEIFTTLTASTTFTLNCGGATSSTTVSVIEPPAITSFTANPVSVAPGGTTTLSWASTNTNTCVASGAWSGSKGATGTDMSGAITSNATFTLTCSGSGGPAVSRSVTVTTQGAAGTVSGRLLVAPSLQTDSDTNDGLQTPVRNNTIATAQSIPNPVVLGGFATKAASGPDGPLRAGGDDSDYFRVYLNPNQTIELTVATPEEGDLDLAVYNAANQLVGSSNGTGTTERVTITQAGERYVQVLAYSGTSNYTLSIGQAGAASLSTGFTLNDDFVPGEILVRFKEDSVAKVGQNMTTATKLQTASRHGMKLSGGAPGIHTLMKLVDGRAQTYAKPESGADAPMQFVNDEVRLKFETLAAIKEIARDPGVEWATPNSIQHTQALPNDPMYSNQRWHYELMRLPDAWNVTTGSTNVIAAVIDTGVRPHADLANLIAGYDFIQNLTSAGDGNGLDNDASDPGTVPTQGNVYGFHGTHVAGTIGASGNNSTGVTGVNWNVSVMPIRVLGVNGSGTENDIINGMLYAARLANSSGVLPAKRADVINMSLGSSSSCSSSYQNAVNQVRAAGVIVVAAAGNESRNGVQPSGSPASCNGVISVSAIGINSQRAAYSNAGAGVDIAAPGGDDVNRIYSTFSEKAGSTYYGSYQLLQGTSMAAPHVAGAIALMKAVNPALTPAQIDTLLSSGALTDDIGPAGPDELGVGRINALKAVSAATTGTAPTRAGQLSVNPSTLNFGDVTTVSSATLNNAGTSAVAVTSVVNSAAWLTAAANQVDANGLGTYRINVNRSGLSVGTYSGYVEFRGNTGTAVRTNVQMQVSSAPVVANAGQHYLLLIDPDTSDTVYQVEVDARGSAVNFTFTGVAAGRYLLAAGTDADNDGFICDAGEACGEYPLYGQPAPVNSGTSNLDFPTTYNVAVRAATASEAPTTETGFRRLK